MKSIVIRYFQRFMSRHRNAHSKFRTQGVQLLLWVIGAVSLGYAITGYSMSAWHQTQAKARFRAAMRTGAADSNASLLRTADRTITGLQNLAPGSLIGVIEIPKLGVSSVVDEGVDNKTLLIAVGHIPGTALPGHEGNVGLAGHRDTFFRQLGQLQLGDDISLTTLGGAYHYKVESTRIVKPSDKEVLDAGPQSTLTLVTCYPFHYVGPAPRRYIVVARQVPQTAD